MSWRPLSFEELVSSQSADLGAFEAPPRASPALPGQPPQPSGRLGVPDSPPLPKLFASPHLGGIHL